MESAAKPFPSGKRASVSDAKAAYFEGDFERCLEICALIRVRTLATASEVSLLAARAYLRTGRPAEAEAELSAAAETHAGLDASLTAQMLLGTAQIRQGDPDGGLARLHRASAEAKTAHFAIASEIFFAIALGYWVKRDIDSAEAYLARVDRRADIIHARALELSAWCQTARGHYRRSAEFFILTLLRLDHCRAQDRAIAGTAISTLAILAAELNDRELAAVVESRSRMMDWTSGLVTHRYLTLLHRALFAEIAGNTVESFELAMEARELAPTTAFAASAWSTSSEIARHAGEVAAAAVFGKRAVELLDTLELRSLEGEERFSILSVAENRAYFDSPDADRLFAAYWGLAPADKWLALSGDPRLVAEESLVSGVIAQARGDVDDARRYYQGAFADFKRIGYVRRAMMAAHALVKLDDDAEMRAYLRAQLGTTANYMTRDLDATTAVTAVPAGDHPIVATLPRAQREVVALICQGKSNKEIASLRNVGEQTIKNMLTKHVFRAFGVSNRAALVSICLRRA